MAKPLIAAALLCLAACATPAARVQGPNPLAGSSWHRIDDEDASPHYATLVFATGSASGYAGCNTWTAQASARANNQFSGTIEFGVVGTTRMMCPPSSMHTEHNFLPVLERARTYMWDPGSETDPGSLRLSDGHGVFLASFVCDDGCPANLDRDIMSVSHHRH